ncbi:MAG: hypothetical protein FIB03_07275, partial [Anaerolineae bacterium]|nr:hypothetical protein [Anaerolineae bacterium]
MGDRELLEKYEPALRFAKSERFFPMAVEPYLERCTIHASGPQGMAGLLLHLNEPLVTRIGKLYSGEYHLRFINDPLIDSDIWIWWAVLSGLALGGGWSVFGTAGVEVALLLSVIAAFIIFIQASPIRLRFFPAAFAVLFFLALEVAPIWFFLRPHPYISIQVEYFVLFPAYLFVLFFLSVRTMRFIFDHIVSEAPGLMLDMISNATETVARKSYHQYAEMSGEQRQPVYYGHVVHEQDGDGNGWSILQNLIFYAFND